MADFEKGQIVIFKGYSESELTDTPDYQGPFKKGDKLEVIDKATDGHIIVHRLSDGVVGVWPEELELVEKLILTPLTPRP